MGAIHPVRVVFAKLGWSPQSFSFFFAALAASTAVAGLSFRFIERPLLGLKARFAGDPGAPGHDARPTSQRVESAAI
jgi:peptidoglycan/LPS O-acetylase OafA/YrhL